MGNSCCTYNLKDNGLFFKFIHIEILIDCGSLKTLNGVDFKIQNLGNIVWN